MKNFQRFQKFMGVVYFLVGLGIIVATRLTNSDMTETQLLVSFPANWILAAGCLVLSYLWAEL